MKPKVQKFQVQGNNNSIFINSLILIAYMGITSASSYKMKKLKKRHQKPENANKSVVNVKQSLPFKLSSEIKRKIKNKEYVPPEITFDLSLEISDLSLEPLTERNEDVKSWENNLINKPRKTHLKRNKVGIKPVLESSISTSF